MRRTIVGTMMAATLALGGVALAAPAVAAGPQTSIPPTVKVCVKSEYRMVNYKFVRICTKYA